MNIFVHFDVILKSIYCFLYYGVKYMPQSILLLLVLFDSDAKLDERYRGAGLSIHKNFKRKIRKYTLLS